MCFVSTAFPWLGSYGGLALWLRLVTGPRFLLVVFFGVLGDYGNSWAVLLAAFAEQALMQIVC